MKVNMKYCSRPFDMMHFDPNGDVRICSWTDVSIGNSVTDDLDDIWCGVKAEEIRDSVRDGSFRYCRATSCPLLENNLLPDLNNDEFIKKTVRGEIPKMFNVACDYICNHSCPSCRDKIFIPDEHYITNLEIILEKTVPLLSKAQEISTCGNGDVFASSYMMRMLEKLRPADRNCRILLETNGTLFDEKHWERISHLGKYDLTVTVTPNSFDRATFKYLNGGHDTYDQLMHNLHFLKSLRKQNVINKHQISIVVQERNFRELPDFIKYCINELEADSVIVKPLYNWFGMSEDMFWFMDVLNPEHPYHSEYLEMMEDPVINDPHVFLWGARNLHEDSKHPAYRYKDYMEMTAKLMNIPDAGMRLSEILHDMGIKDVFLYGDIEFSPVFYRTLAQENIHIKGFIARDIEHDDICGIKVKQLCDSKPEPGDAVIILNYHFIRNIERDFSFYNISEKLIGVDELIGKLDI
jgi:MoaA/NifB/PqqE/SkfB family radical SAM enzyme